MSVLNQLAARPGRAARRRPPRPAVPGRSPPSPSCRRLLRPDPRASGDGESRRHAASRPPSSCRSSAARPTRSRRPSRRASRRSTPTFRTSRSTPTPSRRPQTRTARPSTWPRPGSRSPARPTSSATWPSTGPTASWSATRAGLLVLRGARHPVRGRFLAQRRQPLTVELLQEPRRAAGHGLVRPEPRPAPRPARRASRPPGSRS